MGPEKLNFFGFVGFWDGFGPEKLEFLEFWDGICGLGGIKIVIPGKKWGKIWKSLRKVKKKVNFDGNWAKIL